MDADRTDPNTVDEWGNPVDLEHTRWRWAEVAHRNGGVMHPLVQWWRIIDDEPTRSWPNGWTVGQADDGWFDPEDLAILTVHLRAATLTQEDLVSGAWDTRNLPWAERSERARSCPAALPSRDTWLFSASLGELADATWAQRGVPGWECSHSHQEAPYTSMIGPEDHAWIVASEENCFDSRSEVRRRKSGSREPSDRPSASGHFRRLRRSR